MRNFGRFRIPDRRVASIPEFNTESFYFKP